jgi:beta-glucosidase
MTTTEAESAVAVARRFPAGFLWGAATSAYQIEGAVHADGRGTSIWDTFSHTPGKVRGGDTGDIACDFYNRVESDVALLESIGLGAFRFSLAWPRIQPSGSGAPNQRGLDFYRSLLELLRAGGITPSITLYHWDLPQPLEDAGGWARRETALRFAEYAEIVATALGDAAAIWITLNEPQVVAHQGYRIGTHAPGRTDDALAAAATHHLLLGHGLALERLRASLPCGSQVGISIDVHPVRPWGEGAEEAVRVTDAEENRMYLDPVLHGRYPQAARAHLLPPPELIEDGDMALISAPIDVLGVNYYSPHYVRGPATLARERWQAPGGAAAPSCRPAHLARTSMGWLIEPDGLYDTLCGLAAELAPGCALQVTENGCAAEDYVTPEGHVEDTERVEYLYAHLEAAWRAIRDGVPLTGYFHWSLLDNFEWAWGYQKRFGLVYVDFATQTRVPKRSASAYRAVATSNELPARAALLSAPLPLDGAITPDGDQPAA